MQLTGNEGREFYDKVRQHLGHIIEVAVYGDHTEPWNVAIECVFCSEVLLDADRPVQWILTSDGLAKKVKAEDWSWGEDQDHDFPVAVQTEDGRWYDDDSIAYYSVSHEPTEDEFMEAYGIDAGRAAYQDFLTEGTKQWRAETGQDVSDPICQTCFGKGCGDCINEDGGTDR